VGSTLRNTIMEIPESSESQFIPLKKKKKTISSAMPVDSSTLHNTITPMGIPESSECRKPIHSPKKKTKEISSAIRECSRTFHYANFFFFFFFFFFYI